MLQAMCAKYGAHFSRVGNGICHPGFRERIADWGGGFIVAGDNYGQGSSREHAALAPLQLGVTAVFAKSFARIHRRNLVAQGIVALTFSDPDDYDRAEIGQTWTLPHLRDELAGGGDALTVEVDGSGERFSATHDFSAEERQILLAGGLLSHLRRNGAGGEPSRWAEHDESEPDDGVQLRGEQGPGGHHG
jgi:aconitate hydratase